MFRVIFRRDLQETQPPAVFRLQPGKNHSGLVVGIPVTKNPLQPLERRPDQRGAMRGGRMNWNMFGTVVLRRCGKTVGVHVDQDTAGSQPALAQLFGGTAHVAGNGLTQIAFQRNRPTE